MPEYPLSEKAPDALRSPRGLPFEEITLDAVLDGRVTIDDLRITSEALLMQAEIARTAGRRQLAENLHRAAELVNVPEERILDIYNALRPGRAEPAILEALAQELIDDYGAARCAELLREAAQL